MATKNIVPNADGEGQLGTSSKSWAQGHIDSITGTIATAAQGSITSLGTLTTLTVDNVIVNGTTIGHTSDTDLLTLADSVLTVAGSLGLGGLAVGSYSSAGNDLVLGSTSSNNSGISIVSASGGSSNDSRGNIYFADTTNDTSGFITYLHTSAGEKMRFGVADTLELTITGSGIEISDSGTIGCASDADLLTLTSGQLETNGKIRADGASSQGQVIIATSKALGSLVAGNTIGEVVFQHDLTGPDGVVIAAIADENTAAAEDHHGARLEFYTAANGDNTNNPVNRFTIESDGNVTVEDGDLVVGTAGHGITFSSTNTPAQSAGSGSSNTFDDYEEGTFTPTIDVGFSSPGYSTQYGSYTKVGRIVNAHFRITMNAGTANSSRVRIGGLPFTSLDNGASDTAIASHFVNASASKGDVAKIIQLPNTTLLEIYEQTATGTVSIIGTQVGNAFSVFASVTYET